MNVYWKIFLSTLAFLVLQHILKLVWLLQFHKTVYNHRPGFCEHVKGIDHGSEDIATLSNGKAFITSGMVLPSSGSKFRSYIKRNNVKGQIYLFDFRNADNTAVPLKIEGKGWDGTDFFPHGISKWEDPKTGAAYLYVVNHRSRMDTVDKFLYDSNTNTLQFIKAFMDPDIYYLNDIALTGEDQFYFTNFAGSRSELGILAEIILLLPRGALYYFNGKSAFKVSSGYLLPNGLALSADNRYLYLAISYQGMVKVFETSPNGNLTFLQEYLVHTNPDNPTLDSKTGNILIGSQPVSYKTAKSLEDPSFHSPSNVLYLTVKSGKITSMTELFSDDGEFLSSTSVASIFENRLLIGTITHKLAICQVSVPLSL